MNDDDFDNIFGGKLKRGKNFIFAEESWNKMEKNILQNAADRNRKRGLLWLILPFLFLTGFSAWSSFSLNNLNKKVGDLNAEIVKLQTTQSTISTIVNKESSVQNDTIYHHVIKIKYDTIYRTIVSQNAISENKITPNTSVSSASYLKLGINNLEEDKPTVDGLNKETSTGKINSDATKPENTSDKISAMGKENSDVRIDSLQKMLDKNRVAIEALSAQIQKQLFAQPLVVAESVNIQPAKTPKFELGITGGAAAYIGDSIVNQTGYSIGLRGNYLMSKRFKLVLDAQLASSDYQKNTIYYTPDVPWIAAPTKNDVFSRVYCDQFYLNYNIGLQYALTENKRINPYLGIGVVGQSKIKEQFDYRFINTLQAETSIISKRDDPNFKFPFMRLNFGAELRLLKKFSTQLEGSYDMKLNGDNYSKSFFQLRGVVLYKL